MATDWGGRFKQCLGAVADLVFPPVCSGCGVEIEGSVPVTPVDTAAIAMPATTAATASPERAAHGETGMASRCRPTKGAVRLCDLCLEFLNPTYAQRCRRCGAGQSPSGTAGSVDMKNSWSTQCPHCRRMPFRFHPCHALGNYELGLREAVLKVKAGSHDALIVDLARLLAVRLAGEGPWDGVLPVPTHWRRRMVRRSIVAELLAGCLAREIGVPCWTGTLRCARLTNKQGKLSTSDRILNVKQAFCIQRPRQVIGRRLLLVDDVMTSGATLNETATVCLAAGAVAVGAAVIARGVGRSMNRLAARIP